MQRLSGDRHREQALLSPCSAHCWPVIISFAIFMQCTLLGCVIICSLFFLFACQYRSVLSMARYYCKLVLNRVAELGSLLSGAKMAMKIFIKQGGRSCTGAQVPPAEKFALGRKF